MELRIRARSIAPTLAALALLTSFMLARPAASAVLFEGWSKVLISGQHIGYVIQRYEFDAKKKEYKTISFLKTNNESGGLNDSLVARADAKFKPISYQHTSIANGKPTTIDAAFKGGKMIATVVEGKNKKTVTNTLSKDTFLSAFLGYVMLQSKDGLKKGVKYSYSGVLEEKGIIAKGEAYISSQETVGGIPVFRILNTLDGGKFISLVTNKAEILGSISPTIGVQTDLVATMEEAVGPFGVNSAVLTQLFGSVPKGADNEISRRAKMPKPTAPPATPSATTVPPSPSASPQPAAPIEKPSEKDL